MRRSETVSPGHPAHGVVPTAHGGGHGDHAGRRRPYTPVHRANNRSRGSRGGARRRRECLETAT
eukprot:2575925-Heterocapsa_arctica.AAC.1